MLLVVYRSFVTMLLMLVTVLVELSAARGVVAVLANSGVIGLSTYTTNLLTLLAIAAGTDYAIFVVGRYHEARSAGEDREAAYYAMFRGTVHVIVGSGLTIAGAVACLSFTRLPYFQSLGVPAAIGVLVALAAALTLGPAMLVMASHFGLLEPKRRDAHPRLAPHRHRHRAVARSHPGRVDRAGPDRPARPAGVQDQLRRPPVSARLGACRRRVRGRRTALLRGPAQSRAADDRIRSRHAKPRGHDPARASRQGGSAYPGHRPGAVDHPAPGHANQPQLHTVSDQRQQREHHHEPQLPAGQGPGHPEAGRPDLQVDRHPATTARPATGQRRRDRRTGPGVPRHRRRRSTKCATTSPTSTTSSGRCATTSTGSRTASTFRPVQRCDRCSTPSTASTELADKFGTITASLDKLNALQPQLVALIPPQLAVQEANRDLLRSNYATTAGTDAQSAEALKTATAMGKAFDDAKNDDSFYLPPEAFDNPDFKRGLKLFMSPDGQAVAHDHHPRGQSRDAGGDLAHRRDQELGVRRAQGHPAGGRQGLRRRNRGDLQGHSGRRHVRPDDRRAGRR